MFGDVDDTEYKLEKVRKTRRVVDGFSYTFQSENNILKIALEPRHISVKPLVLLLSAFIPEQNYQYSTPMNLLSLQTGILEPIQMWKLES